MNKRFKRIYLEISNICNLNCSFCPIDERDHQLMSVENFEAALKKVIPFTDEICLHLMGEPLAHPHIEEIFDLCEKNLIKIQLTTNGLLLKKHKDLILKTKVIRQVNISAQSYLDNFKTRPIKPYLDMILDFINSAFELRDDLYLNIRMWNIDSLDEKRNDEIFTYFENEYQVTINRNVDVSSIKSKKVINKLYFHFDSVFEWPRLTNEFQSLTGRCNALKDHLAIHADGTIVPCCLDDQKIIKLGNIFESSLQDVLNNQRLQEMLKGFSKHQRVEKLCQHCSFISRF